TYGFAIRKPLRKVYQKTLGKFNQKPSRLFMGAYTYGFAIRGYCASRSFGFQTTGMQSIPEHHVNRGIGLRGHRVKRGVAFKTAILFHPCGYPFQ
ncbi:MAG: hypothetical protein WA102_00080, partial [Candidatus Methanoperedens sp.]